MKIAPRKAILITALIAATLAVAYFLIIKESEPRIYRIGIIIDNDIFLPNIEGFKSKIKELGYEEGNVEYVLKNVKSQPDLYVRFSKELVDSRPDLIISGSNIATRELKKLTTSIPIVFLDIGIPAGLIENVREPEANITGVTGGGVEFVGKRLELLKEAAPGIKKVIISPDINFPNYPLFIKNLSEASGKLGVEIVEIPSKNIKDFILRSETIISKKNGDAFIFFSGPNNALNDTEDRKRIVDLLKKEKLPSITHNMELAANQGILIGYGVYRGDVGREAAILADRVLKGTPIKSLPIISPLKSLVLEVNLETAKEIGVVFPEGFLLRVNKIYRE